MALLAIVIIGTVVLNSQEQMKGQELKNSLGKIKQEADFACTSDDGALNTGKIVLASGSVLTIGSINPSNANKICITYKGSSDCLKSLCQLEAVTETFTNNDLNLNTPQIISLYSTHEFSCTFEKKGVGVVAVNCKG